MVVMVVFDRLCTLPERLTVTTTRIAVFVFVVLLLTFPCLFSGFQLDDFPQNLILQGDFDWSPSAQPFSDLFCFAEGSADPNFERIDQGLLPWWSNSQLRVRFLRPISVLTHWCDHQLWPRTPAAMHVHSLCWYLLTISLCYMLYRRFTTRLWVAVLAVVMFAVDDVHAVTVTWIANRNHLIACVLVLVAFFCHMRWRLEGRSFYGWMSAGVFLIALLAGEAAVAFGAFVIAWAVAWETGDGLWRRLFGILPSLLTGFVWLTFYRLYEYGSHGSGGYVDPAGEPVQFFLACCERLPTFLSTLSGASSSDLRFTFYDGMAPHILLGYEIVTTVLGAVVVIPFLRQDRAVRFWSVALIISLLPLCAAFPSDRVLLLASVSSHGLIARVIELIFGTQVLANPVISDRGIEAADVQTPVQDSESWTAPTAVGEATKTPVMPNAVVWRRTAYLIAGFWLFAHLPLSICLMPLRCSQFVEHSRQIQAGAHSQCLRHSQLGEQNVILINPPDPFFLWHFTAIRRHDGLTPPRHTWSLGTGFTGLTLRRVDQFTLEVEVAGNLLSQPAAGFFRHAYKPLHQGWTRKLSGVAYTVTEISSDGNPKTFQVRCDRSVDSDEYLWLRWGDREFVPWTPPAIGNEIFIAPVSHKDSDQPTSRIY